MAFAKRAPAGSRAESGFLLGSMRARLFRTAVEMRAVARREGRDQDMSKLNRILKTKAATRLVPEARPFRSDPKGAKEAVLLLHGFTGMPCELSIVGAALAAGGFSCLAPRYPGHGTDRADFLATGAEDWLRRAVDSYLDLASEYETVHVLGHSMGGLIATIVAAAFNAPRLVLLAPAFKISGLGARLAPLVAPFAPVIRKNRPNGETDPVRRKLFSDYWADDLVSGVVQLKRLHKAAHRDLARIHSKVLVVVGAKDEVVPASVAKLVEERAMGAASFESRTIEGAGHLFPFDAHAAQSSAIVAEWMSRG
jgi:carboxylesterase